MVSNGGLTKEEQIYQSAREDLLRRQLSNAEAYDRAILTLSSGAIALTITLLKSSGKALARTDLLQVSWYLFGAAIVGTLASFLVSQKAIDQRLATIWDYYIERKEAAARARNRWDTANTVLVCACGLLFIGGVLFTLRFCWINL